MKIGITGNPNFYNYDFVEGVVTGILDNPRGYSYFESGTGKKKKTNIYSSKILVTDTTGVAELGVKLAEKLGIEVEIKSASYLLSNTDTMFVFDNYDNRSEFSEEFINKCMDKNKSCYKIWVDKIDYLQRPRIKG